MLSRAFGAEASAAESTLGFSIFGAFLREYDTRPNQLAMWLSRIESMNRKDRGGYANEKISLRN